MGTFVRMKSLKSESVKMQSNFQEATVRNEGAQFNIKYDPETSEIILELNEGGF